MRETPLEAPEKRSLDLKKLHETVRSQLKKEHAAAVEGLSREHEELLCKRVEGRNRFTRFVNRFLGRNRVVSFENAAAIEEMLSSHQPALVIVRDFKVDGDEELARLSGLLEKRRGKTKLVFLQKPGAVIMKGDKGIRRWVQVTSDWFISTYHGKSFADRHHVKAKTN
jgi:hypothetical protein